MIELKDKLISLGKESGATDVHFANITELPQNINKGYKNAVVVVVKLSMGILKEIKDKPTISYFSHYRTANRLIDVIVFRLASLLEAEGYPSFPIVASQTDPTKEGIKGVFSHKMAGVLSGQGFIGKNTLFIHNNYGIGVRLGTVLTNAPLAEKKEIVESKCGPCSKCKIHCPGMAIEGVNWKPGVETSDLMDVKCCSEYMKKNFIQIGRGAVCGLCMVCCPYL